MVIVDTSVWIPALNQRSSPEKNEVAHLVESGQAAIVGIVLTEVLRGARTAEHLEELSYQILAAEYIESDMDTWMMASHLYVDLKLKGQTIPIPDAVIAAHAIRGGHSVYTHDEHFDRIPDLELHRVI